MRKILILSFFIIFSSCSKDFLEQPSLTNLASENFWKTEQDALLGIHAIYDGLQDRIQYSGNLNGFAAAGFPMYDCFGDNVFNATGWLFVGPGNYMLGNVDPNYQLFATLWISLYRGIGRANLAIENISKMPASAISDQRKNQLLAQAYFLRGLFYSHIAIYFQNAPLILKVQALEESYVAKNTYQEISDQVVKDLTFAATNLPNSYPAAQYGYATRGAALGILARSHLYNKNYQGVLDATATIMTLGYTLDSDYARLFTEAGESSREIIFSVRFNQDVSANNELFSATFATIPRVESAPMKNLVDDYLCTDGRPITTSPLYNAANPRNNRDPRCTATIYFQGDIFLTDLNRAFAGNTATRFGQRKYVRRAASSTGIAVSSPGGQDFIVLRYADVLLMRAEALLETNQLTEVYTLINQVRARVSMPTVQSVDGPNLSQTALRTILRRERRVELAIEGLRFFDLKRWGTMQQAFQAIANDRVPGYIPTYRGVKSETFPISQSEINVNQQLTQNAGWQ
ncbi:RagB/SusD family nutrient uptake outer membrane protein [Sediminibacterium sp.]|uniref:RagB/SusD family nutrient uptake outer membrane protein n=1 Tax=Sediminibacterium sp. TaxID=1917865 RepID=UPI0025E0448C|nr:RagB/SusD family nutrient uptake outer membrane protein [Sediminibacterium sp.]MBT9484670.1 RagB/SusD family nutrient uptake outer membrane protein [Sediminibacterium sp.]